MTLSHQLQAATGNRAAECDPGVKCPSSWDALGFPHAVLGRVMLHLPCWLGPHFQNFFCTSQESPSGSLSYWQALHHIPLASPLHSDGANALHKEGLLDPFTAGPCIQQVPVSLKFLLLFSQDRIRMLAVQEGISGLLYSFFSRQFHKTSSEFSWITSAL